MTLVLLLALGCDPDPVYKLAEDDDIDEEDDGQDSGVPDSGGDDDGPTGEASGARECMDGVCTVSAGPFWRGDDDINNARPAGWVDLSAYAIGDTEVTQSDWAACVDAGACDALPAHCTPDGLHDDRPAVCVTWDQAGAYCGFVGGRLPTEAEWEKAARGEQGATWAWGNDAPVCTTANFRYASWYCHEGPVDVGSYADQRSPFGLWDTVGNVWEWTADGYEAAAYVPDAVDPLEDDCPTDADDAGCARRVLRGGAYNTTESTTKAAARSAAEPGVVDVNIGVRCAWDL